MVVTRSGAVALMLVVAACADGGGDSRTDPSAASFVSVANPSESAAETTGSTSTTGEPDPTTTVTGSSSGSSSGGEPTTGALGTTGEASSSEGGESSSTGVMVGCGDGVVDAPEVCDDANQVDGDGCNNDCTLSGQLLWQSTQEGGVGLADEGIGCAIDGTGAIHVAGYLSVGPGDDDLWVRKYSFSGVPIWTQTHAGTAMLKDQGRAVVVDAAALVYVAGFANNLMQDNDVLVRKFASDGKPTWAKAHNGAAMLSDSGNAALLTLDGSLVVAGAVTVAGAGTDTWLRKYSLDGMQGWTRTYAGAGKGNEAAHALTQAADGSIYAAGQETVPGEGTNIWLGKYDPDGNLSWSKLYSGTAGKNDFLYGAVAMDDGGVVVCGYETAVEIPWKSFLRRYDAAGKAMWTEIDAGPEMLGALCWSVDLAANGDILYAGGVMQGATREPRVRRLTPDGVELWSTIAAGPGTEVSQARCVRAAPDGTIVVAGSQDVGVDGRDIWVARFSP
jgi:cysteine-rich repeat protein